MNMKILSVVLVLAGCTRLSPEERAISGEWDWDYRDSDLEYFYGGYISLRSDGQYSTSSESYYAGKGLADDSFGIHRYGWLVRDGFVCFVDSRNARLDRVVEDPQASCNWKITLDADGDPKIEMPHRYSDKTAVIRLIRSPE